MTENERRVFEGKERQMLSRLNAYAKANNLSNRKVAEKIGVPHNTLTKWWFFTQSKGARSPSKPYLEKVREFLETKEAPEVYQHIQEATHRTEKIKYLLLLLEDELRWFRDNDARAREKFRKGLNASDIGYISSLVTMLTEEDKFKRWLALTTMRFQSFKRR
ncbi:MAG: helix-turn-helix transcriptional regulator [Chloroflexi bacterium]|nr:helix-turn-helix transcriptional regulator [Chloroflexota bacterium]